MSDLTDPQPSAEEDDLGPACVNLRCSWQPIPHVHEDDAIYPLPPERIEWIAALATSEDVPHD